MARRDWLLLLIGDGLEPIRIQKGMFLFAMESEAPAGEKVQVHPVQLGPVEPAHLRRPRCVVRRGTDPGNPDSWRLLPPLQGDGDRARARRSVRVDSARVAHHGHSGRTRAAVTGVGFGALLRRVYDKYPEFAANSVFKG